MPFQPNTIYPIATPAGSASSKAAVKTPAKKPARHHLGGTKKKTVKPASAH